MKKTFAEFNLSCCVGSLLVTCTAAALSACGGSGSSGGGGGMESDNPQVGTPVATGVITLQLNAATFPDAAGAATALPAFHMAPALLNEPDDIDADGSETSARRGPRRHVVPGEFRGLSSRLLTAHALETARQTRTMRYQGVEDDSAAPMADGSADPMVDASADPMVGGSSNPMAAGSPIRTYSPAQIRAAYGLPALPSIGATLTATQAAQLGAGQTIYVVDAMHDPNVAAELTIFSQKFGLPACTTMTISASTSLPLAAAITSGCELSVVYSTASGTMTGVAPAYDSGWASEIAVDVEWAHATAPLARIILIEAPDTTCDSLLGAVKLANSMGPGIVSMSFAGPEGDSTASVDSVFTVANMTYLASVGDFGAGVSWPAVSPNVVAVGGTTMTYSGAGARSEVSWSGTGGGISAYTATPNYQNNAVPGLGNLAHRAVADVAFNADPATGQYVVVVSPGSSTATWLSAGGTSLATPQWAGLIALADAQRAIAGKPALGAPHAVLYGLIATVPGTYASAFADITEGSDGTCDTCSAKIGYDELTGLGTPNVASLLTALSAATPAATPPVVNSAGISGKVGTALTFNVLATAPNPVTYTLSGAPAGMTISVAGAVTWDAPVAGAYAVTATATDTKSGLSGYGIYTVTIALRQPPVDVAANGPVITAPAMTGAVGKPLTGTLSFSDPGATVLWVTIAGVPLDMAFSVSGLTITARWDSPGPGGYSYNLAVSVIDSAGLTAKAHLPMTIAAN